jgi:cytochrome P450
LLNPVFLFTPSLTTTIEHIQFRQSNSPHLRRNINTRDCFLNRVQLNEVRKTMLARHRSFRPPAPVPYPNTPGPLDLVRMLWSNPIEEWTKANFEEPILCTRLPFGDVVAVNDPAAMRRVLQENEANYCKDRFQKRMLAALSGGLLTAEDEHWYSQRRLIAPLFRPSMIKDMAPAMVGRDR